MKVRVVALVLTLAGFGFGLNTPAHAVGCLSGGLAGAVAGHMAHHGVLGAVGGCIAGHEYNKHQRRAAAAQDQRDMQYQPGTDRGTAVRGSGQDD